MDQIQIFISYAREDQERVKSLYHRLVKAGFYPWLDREHILPGMRWEPVLQQALKRANFVLICLSATSINKRGFLQKEIKQALEHAQEKMEDDLWVIPARLDNCDVPDSLSGIQWVDLFEDDGWDRLVGALEFQLKKQGKSLPAPGYKLQSPKDPPLQQPSGRVRRYQSPEPLTARQQREQDLIEKLGEVDRTTKPHIPTILRNRGIPGDFYQSLRKTLEGCREFKDSAELDALFVTENLRPWATKVPRRDNVSSRVKSVISLLWGERSKDGEHALVNFLHNLAGEYDEDDSLNAQLLNLAERCQAILTRL